MYPPLERFGISSPYGSRSGLMGDFHFGCDIPCPVGTDLVAITDGSVALANWISFTYAGKAYKELVLVINRTDGHFNIYDHLSEVLVSKGQRVSKGQLVARSGQSGYVTGPHFHCQLSIGQYTGGLFANYKTQDPEPELRAWTLQGGSDEMTNLEDFKNCFFTQAYRMPNEDEMQRWQGSGLASYDWVHQNAHFPMKEERDKAVESLKLSDDQAVELTTELSTAKQDAELAHSSATNLQTELSRAQEALKEAQKPQPTPEQVNCQQKIDKAVQDALEAINNNPLPAMAAWIGKTFHLNTKGGGKQ